MRLIATALAAAVLVVQDSCSAFTLNKARQVSPSFTAVAPLLAVKTDEETDTGAPCAIPDDVEVVSLVNEPNGGRKIRYSVVTDVNGDFIPLDRPMGKGKSVVVFLRHLG